MELIALVRWQVAIYTLLFCGGLLVGRGIYPPGLMMLVLASICAWKASGIAIEVFDRSKR